MYTNSQECVQIDNLQYVTNSMNSSELDNTKIEKISKEPAKNETLSQRKSISKLTKTKKKKNQLHKIDKDAIWDIFDKDIQTIKETTDDNDENETKQNLDVCYSCRSPLFIMEDRLPICSNTQCGIANTKMLDYSPEWRFYGAEDKNAKDPSRCGNPINPLLVQSSFGCKVLCNSKSSYEMRRIRKWTEWQSMPHKEKSLYDEFQFITTMAHNAGIPKIFIDDAITIHKDISEQKMFRGLNRDGIKSASIYISCRLNGCPRNAHEIADIFKLDKTSATNGCSMAVNILNNIERDVLPSEQTELGITLPISFIERYCSKLNISTELTAVCRFVAKKVQDQHLITDNIPHAITAGIIYFVANNCNLNISKQDIRTMSGVSEVTINKCFKKLESFKDNLIPSVIINKYT
uniref:Transcription factor TFIIB cyclin-like domain-containing protein n=1 Tax=viral metagenome TaxID=1070528 RepID=A0A6C0ISL7_9ZZZZ